MFRMFRGLFKFIFNIIGANTLELLEELGLQNDIMPVSRNHMAVKNRMIFTAQHGLCILPSSLTSAFFKTPPFSKSLVGMILNDLRTKSVEMKEDSIYNFTKRRFGKEFADYLIGPLICGICAGDAQEISVNFLMRSMFEMEQNYGGVIKGYLVSAFKNSNKTKESECNGDLTKKAKNDKWSFYSLKGGLEKLPLKLAENLKNKNVKINTHITCNELRFSHENVEIITNNGNIFQSAKVISTLPAHQLALTVKKQHPKLAEELTHISYVDVAVVNLLYTEPNLIKKPGFGVLVPPIEELPILGITFDSVCFNYSDKTVLTVMMGGKWFNRYFGENFDECNFSRVAVDQIKQILGIYSTPCEIQVHILRKCIPQYKVGHEQILTNIKSYISKHNLPIVLCGNYLNGIGINDVIFSAKEEIYKYFN